MAIKHVLCAVERWSPLSALWVGTVFGMRNGFELMVRTPINDKNKTKWQSTRSTAATKSARSYHTKKTDVLSRDARTMCLNNVSFLLYNP